MTSNDELVQRSHGSVCRYSDSMSECNTSITGNTANTAYLGVASTSRNEQLHANCDNVSIPGTYIISAPAISVTMSENATSCDADVVNECARSEHHMNRVRQRLERALEPARHSASVYRVATRRHILHILLAMNSSETQ